VKGVLISQIAVLFRPKVFPLGVFPLGVFPSDSMSVNPVQAVVANVASKAIDGSVRGG